MRHTLAGVIGAAIIILAGGCSSKKAASTSDAAGSGYGSGKGGGSGVDVENLDQRGGRGTVIGDVFFDFDSSALSPEAQEQLKQNAAWMQKNSYTSVTIEGHCDERGTDEYNIALGERRAEAAQNYLINLGVSNNRLSTVSYGEEKPFDTGNNEEAWAKNRRDHFVTK
ncbi:peptidoglycan-associated lipoprotein Pal [Chlorobaculum thiosulfatiphilum]|jgi:peptidoglycan-associated lipoprotein|uniref:Peptidoglycan-associated lipoprotein n=1 Tax=Chlorobaculum thiosulfatiphilum TaxID=115852 RepID=A0A5C4S6Q4_CHLTI|nr:peptidoglycan-associated lipoprotein Pal [Chlorobaculum thiosulfatiphilum]TNJ39200.1 peptidoglycan-associated lipoprotein Pal [Chlorobaculum thiosulfatiphilum]